MFDNLPPDSQALLLGLSAVVAGLIGNTLLEWIRVAIASRHQRAMVRRALLAELEAAHETVAHNLKSLRSDPVQGDFIVRMPIRENYPAFKWSLPHIGLLTGPEISAVFKAYDYLDSWSEIITLVGRIERVDGRLFGHVPASNCETIALAAEDRVRIIKSTLDLLQR